MLNTIEWLTEDDLPEARRGPRFGSRPNPERDAVREALKANEGKWGKFLVTNDHKEAMREQGALRGNGFHVVIRRTADEEWSCYGLYDPSRPGLRAPRVTSTEVASEEAESPADAPVRRRRRTA